MMTDRTDHEEAPPSKRLKSDKSPTMTLNEDALALVMEFVGPRELYRLAFACKGLRDRVTTKLVLQSTILNTVAGSFPKITLNVLAGCIEAQRIHVPSPCRLLRLVNGKRCEICNVKQVNHVRENNGCFLCPKCQRKVSSKMTRRQYNSLPDFLREDSRIGSDRLKECPLKEQLVAPGGERIGQLFTYTDILAIAQTSGSISVDDYLGDVLQVPSSADDCDKWIEDYNNVTTVETRMKEEQWAKDSEKARKKIKYRKEMLQGFIGQITKYLDAPWKDFALDFDKSEVHFTEWGSFCGDSVSFRCPFVNAIMDPFATAPSKAKKKLAAGVARNINRVYRRIQEEGLLSFHFLDDNDPIEARLKAYALQHWSDLKSFVHSPTFCHFGWQLSNEFEVENLSLVDCWMSQNFGFLLVEPGSDPWVLGLAQSVWCTKALEYVYGSGYPPARFLENFQHLLRGAFRLCESAFAEAKQRAETFLSWLAAEGADENEIHCAEAFIQRHSDKLQYLEFEEFRTLYND